MTKTKKVLTIRMNRWLVWVCVYFHNCFVFVVIWYTIYYQWNWMNTQIHIIIIIILFLLTIPALDYESGNLWHVYSLTIVCVVDCWTLLIRNYVDILLGWWSDSNQWKTFRDSNTYFFQCRIRFVCFFFFVDFVPNDTN